SFSQRISAIKRAFCAWLFASKKMALEEQDGGNRSTPGCAGGNDASVGSGRTGVTANGNLCQDAMRTHVRRRGDMQPLAAVRTRGTRRLRGIAGRNLKISGPRQYLADPAAMDWGRGSADDIELERVRERRCDAALAGSPPRSEERSNARRSAADSAGKR